MLLLPACVRQDSLLTQILFAAVTQAAKDIMSKRSGKVEVPTDQELTLGRPSDTDGAAGQGADPPSPATPEDEEAGAKRSAGGSEAEAGAKRAKTEGKKRERRTPWTVKLGKKRIETGNEVSDQDINVLLNMAAEASPEFERHARNFFKKQEIQIDSRYQRDIRVLEGYDFAATRQMVNGENKLYIQVDVKSKVISQDNGLRMIDGALSGWSQDPSRRGELLFSAPPRSECPACQPSKKEFCEQCQTCLQCNAANEKKPEAKFTRNQQEVMKLFVGLTVYTKYNNMSYRVLAVRFDMTPQSTFSKGYGDNRVEIVYAQYLNEKYNIRECSNGRLGL